MTSARPRAVASAGGKRPASRDTAGSSRVTVAIGGSGVVANADDLVFALSGGRVDGDDVALELADQRARHRRGNRDQALLDVGFEVADDLIGFFFVGFTVGEVHGGTEHD